MNIPARVLPSLHLLTLWGFAVAQPLFDMIGRNPAFLTAHQFGPSEATILALMLALVLPGIPVIVAALISRVERRAGQVVHLGLVGILAALLAMQGLWRTLVWPEPAISFIAAAVALLSMWAYYRHAWVRSFLSVLSPAILVFPALFLLVSPAARLFDTVVPAEPGEGVHRGLPHIVFLVFDELPTTVFMDRTGRIDRENFPTFDRLAKSAYWFRNATTVHTRTEHAMPAILTGMRPKLDRFRIPTDAEFPDNLFTWAARHYRVVASEPLTDLCPIRVCSEDVGLGAPKHRTKRVLRDLATIYLHIVLPPSSRVNLPPINRSWADFDEPQFDLHQKVVTLNSDGRHRQAQRFIQAIDSSPQPTLYFMHANLPHLPYEYLPDGTRYFMHSRIRGLKPGVKLDTWLSDATALNDAYQRFFAQVRYVDKIVGDVIHRLQEQGIYDDSLFIVTADHGVSIRHNDMRRAVTDANRWDIAGVPLFIKLPNQSIGDIVDRNVETIDIMASISGITGIPLTWTPDGSSVFGDRVRERNNKNLVDGPKIWELSADLMVNRGEMTDTIPAPVVNQELVQGLLGRPISDFDIHNAVGIKTFVKRPQLFENVDFEVYLPAHVVADMEADQVDLTGAVIAIAVNGAIRALTKTHSTAENKYGFSQLLPASAFRPGHNSVAVYWVPAPESAPETLAELARID
ncbi:MAG: sulfatase-like hydrolase/transferase [Gammaproteobacteria bacterium]|nr:sulfatase-like hydrolase/transferase [Gammaproteobacteria bacterium]